MKKIFIVLLSIFFISCGSNKKNQITFVLDWTPNTNHTGLYVAKELGYYEKEGLNVNIIQPPEDGAAILVASNKAQFGIGMQDSLASAFLRKNPLPITGVATIIQHNTSGIISLKEKGITSPKYLENKTYATWEIPVEQAMIKEIINEDGGNFKKLKMIPSTVTDVVTALKTNIDAVWVYYAWDGIVTEIKGLDTNYLDFGKLKKEFDFYTPIIIASNEYLKNNPEKAKAFLRATAKGYEYAIENPEKAAEILLKAVPELDKNLVIESQKYLVDKYKAEVKKWGYIDKKRWDSFYFWLSENNLIDGEVTSGKGFTNEFLQ